ncbi:type II toxin-antitoxin system Phd/YefM family antitoxin [Pseudodesulfovibrio tunisiensis]|uniref:type II toxin-antitoxin system Phd/YefM family antitoxin n=1 Tax=Pseudodesulfovibrio tunisiensis TaxID=463192 RepID=UPI001FB2169A|nr:type II toxin-antitoxin system prevent-host-death family antitoxin [Pseudodesulfovibrio tunisiensis]
MIIGKEENAVLGLTRLLFRALDPPFDMYYLLYSKKEELMPEAITYTEARQKLASKMDEVCDTHEPVIITRRKAEAVVMMSLRDYNSITETAYLLRSPANAALLRASIQAAESGHLESHTLMEE